MKNTFVKHRFKALFLVSTLSMVIEYLVMLSDNIIAGNMLGEDALAAITLISPFVGILGFAGSLISMGSAISISYAVGKGDQEEANQFFSQGLILAIGVSILLTLIFVLMSITGFGFKGISEGVAAYVRQYFGYLCFLPLVSTCNSYIYSVALNEGGERLCSISSFVHIALNIVLSILLCKLIGIGGISLATVISNAVALIIVSAYFAGKDNLLRFKWHLNARKIVKMLKYSINDSSIYLCMSLSVMALNMFLLNRYGERAIVIFSVVSNIMMMLSAGFDGIGQSIAPLINTYRGENSVISIVKTMKYANKVALIEGLATTAGLLVFAGLIPRCFGITDPAIIQQATTAVRIYSVSSVAFCFLMLYSSYYLYMDKVLLAFLITVLFLLMFPVLCGIGVGYLTSLNGVWIGLVLACVPTLLLMFMFINVLYPNKTFPFLMDKDALACELTYDVSKTQKDVMELVYAVERDLTARGVDRSKIFKIMLMIEETEMLALERGEEPKKAIECNILLGDEITLILRDNGEGQDVTDADMEVHSLTVYTATSILAAHKHKQYLPAVGKNRIIYKF